MTYNPLCRTIGQYDLVLLLDDGEAANSSAHCMIFSIMMNVINAVIDQNEARELGSTVAVQF